MVPDPERELPIQGSNAVAYIEAALSQAELSVHLLGERTGFTPEGAAPIVSLQLERAGAYAGELIRGNAPRFSCLPSPDLGARRIAGRGR